MVGLWRYWNLLARGMWRKGSICCSGSETGLENITIHYYCYDNNISSLNWKGVNSKYINNCSTGSVSAAYSRHVKQAESPQCDHDSASFFGSFLSFDFSNRHVLVRRGYQIVKYFSARLWCGTQRTADSRHNCETLQALRQRSGASDCRKSLFVLWSRWG